MQEASKPARPATSALARREVWMLLAGLLFLGVLLRLWPRMADVPLWLLLPAAALLLLAVLAFGAWQWQQSPKGLIPAQPFSHAAAQHGAEDDD